MDPNHPNDRALHRKLERLTELIRDADLRLARMPVLRGSIEVHADRSKLEATIGGLTQHLSERSPGPAHSGARDCRAAQAAARLRSTGAFR